MDGRLGIDDKPAHQHGQRNEQILCPPIRQSAAEHIAEGREADVHAGQEQYKTHIRQRDADQDPLERTLFDAERKELEQQEKDEDRQQCNRDLREVGRKLRDVLRTDLPGRLKIADKDLRGGASTVVVDKAEDQHRKNRPDGAERDQTEAIGFRVLVASDGGHADAERHDERHRHRAGRDAAGVKRDRKKVLVGKGSQSEDHSIKENQKPLQWDPEQNAQHTDRQEQSDADGDGDDQNGRVDLRNVFGQHLQVRLRNGNDYAEHKAQDQDHAQLF